VNSISLLQPTTPHAIPIGRESNPHSNKSWTSAPLRSLIGVLRHILLQPSKYDFEMRFQTLRKLDDGELLLLAEHNTREEAERSIESFKEHWAGVYVIREVEDTPRHG